MMRINPMAIGIRLADKVHTVSPTYAREILKPSNHDQAVYGAEGLEEEALGFQADAPVGIGVSGGRVRIAFMHPDMGRFYGPAWQMPIGARDEAGACCSVSR